jgi:transposase-like protein
MNTQELTPVPARTGPWQGAAGNNDPFGDDGFALAIASGTSIKEAARSAGVSQSTAYRRLKDPAFLRRVSEIRASFLNEAVGLLSEAANEAVSTLKALLTARAESVRLSAARAILELGPKLREQAELEERVTALERAAAGESDEEEDEGEEVDADDDEA